MCVCEWVLQNKNSAVTQLNKTNRKTVWMLVKSEVSSSGVQNWSNSVYHNFFATVWMITRFWLAAGCQLIPDIRTHMDPLKQLHSNCLYLNEWRWHQLAANTLIWSHFLKKRSEHLSFPSAYRPLNATARRLKHTSCRKQKLNLLVSSHIDFAKLLTFESC